MGSISGLNWNSITLIAIVSVICLPLLYSKAWDLNLMTVGDEGAKSMGVNAGHIRIFVMIISSLLVAALVAFVGVIGFIGPRAPSRVLSWEAITATSSRQQGALERSSSCLRMSSL